MKIGGVSVTAPVQEILVIPRGEKSLVFRFVAVPNMDEFYKLCPEPTPPGKFVKGEWVPEPEAKDFQEILRNYNRKRLAYMVVTSLEPSEIEWDTVDINNHKTWSNWDSDLRKAGMTQAEINKVFEYAVEVNTLSEARLAKAREAFLRGQARESAGISGPLTEQPSSPSGEPASE